MSSNVPRNSSSGDDLWSVAFSNVGRAYGKPMSEEEIAEAIKAISGPNSGNGAAGTTHTLQSQLYMNPPSTGQQEEGSGQQYDFVLCAPPSVHHGAAEQDIITIGTDGMAVGTSPYPTKSCGIPGRRAHQVPGSSRPWRVNGRC